MDSAQKVAAIAHAQRNCCQNKYSTNTLTQSPSHSVTALTALTSLTPTLFSLTHRQIVAGPNRAVPLAAGKERTREHERPIDAARAKQLPLGGGHVLVETVPVGVCGRCERARERRMSTKRVRERERVERYGSEKLRERERESERNRT